MHQRNGRRHVNVIAVQKLFFLSFGKPSLYGRSVARLAAAPVERPDGPAKEPSMELKTRLNVLATIMSFGFLVAIVFGVI
jgi:hypothetical protein